MPVSPGTGGVSTGGGTTGTSQNAGIADNLFGDTGQTGDITSPPITITPAADKATAASTRDTYFGSNPANLTFYDNNPELGIYLYYTSGGDTVTTFQTRVASAWVDSTTTVGVQGQPGDNATSLFFDSISARDTFFTSNLSLLENDLPITVNVGDNTTSDFVWTGATSPGAYDPDLWRTASGEVGPGTLFLGLDSANISSGNEVINFNTADARTAYVIGVRFTSSGSEVPFYWELAGETDEDLATTNTGALADPQTLTYDTNNDQYMSAFKIVPNATGDLRTRVWIGTDATGPIVLDFDTTIIGGDVGNQTTLTFPNRLMFENGTDLFIEFSGVALEGGLQVGGEFIGQTVPVLTSTAQLGSQKDFVAQRDPSLDLQPTSPANDAELALIDTTAGTQLSIRYDEGLDENHLDVERKLEIGDDVFTAFPDTSPLVSFTQTGTDGADANFTFGDRDPSGLVTGDPGDIYFRADVGSSSDIFINTGAATGTTWTDVLGTATNAVTGPVSSAVNALSTWADTSGDALNSVDNSSLNDTGSTITLDLQSPSASGTSRYTLSDSSGTLKGELEYLETSDSVEMLFVTSEFAIGAGPSASTVRIIGNDTELSYETGGGNNAFTIDMSASPDTNPPFIIDNAGSNGATVAFHVGVRDPEGAVSADPGDIYYRANGTASRIYQLMSASSGNTGWVSAQGDVIGPTTSTINSIPTWADATGDMLNSLSGALLTDDGTDLELRLSTPTGSGTSSILIADEFSTPTISLTYDDSVPSAELEFTTINGGTVRGSAGLVLRVDSTADSVDVKTAGADTQPVMSIESEGTNGALINVHTGTQNPEGIVTADPGDLYIRESGATSGLFQLEAASSGNTGWVEHGGNVTGPGSSVDNAITTWDGTSGTAIQSVDNLISTDDGSNLLLQFNTPTNGGTASIALNDESLNENLRISYDDNSNEVDILASSAQLNMGHTTGFGSSGLTIFGDDILFELEESFSLVTFNASHDDNVTLFNILTSGPNSGSVDFFVGNRNPTGNVSGTPGDIYYRSDGVNSDIYLHRGASGNNTDWVDILATQGDVSGPGSSTDNALPTWNGTGGNSLNSVGNATLTDDGTTTQLTLESPSASGFVNYRFRDSSSVQQALLSYNEASDRFTLSANCSGGLSITEISGDLDLSINGATTQIEMLGIAHPDTANLLFLETQQTNGASVEVYVGDRTPESNVTGAPGSIYIRSDGANSRIYQLENGSTSNTGWISSLPEIGSTTQNSFAIWNSAGDSIAALTQMTASESGGVLDIRFDPPATNGTIQLALRDTSAVEHVILEYDEGNNIGGLIVNNDSGVEEFRLVYDNAANEIQLSGDDDLVFSSTGQFDMTSGDEFTIDATGDELTLIGNTGVNVTADTGTISLTNTSGSGFVSVVGTNTNDTGNVMRLTASGTNGASIDIHVGTRNPEGLVTGTGGDLYVRDNGTSSTMYVKQSASSSTADWTDVLDSLGGDVVGPGSSTLNYITVFDNTSGTAIDQRGNAYITDTSTTTLMHLGSVNASGSANILFEDETQSFRGVVGYSVISDMLSLSSTADLDISTSSATGVISIDGTALPDTLPLLTLDTGGTNGAVVALYVGDRTPEGNVNANPGSVYFRRDGASSDIYLHRAASAGTTGWVDLLETGVKSSIGSSVDNAMVIWDGTSGDTIQQDSLILSVSSGSAGALEILSPSVSGFAGITFEDSTSTTVFTALFDETNGTFLLQSETSSGMTLDGEGGLSVISDDDIIISANANANLVTINTDFVFNDTTTDAELDIECPTATGSGIVQFQNASSVQRGEVRYNQNTDVFSIETFLDTTQLLITSEEQPVNIDVQLTDANPILNLSNTQNDFNIFSRQNSPGGQVSGTNGDIVVAGNGLSATAIHLNKGSSSNTSWAQVDMQQKAFEVVNTTSTLSQAHNRILVNNTSDITLSLPTNAATSIAQGFEQTITKTTSNDDIVTIDTPGFWGHTGNYVIGRVGDSVTYIQTSSNNEILNSNRNVFAVMSRPRSAGELSIAGATGADIVLNGFTQNNFSYPGLAESDFSNDRIRFPDVEDLSNGDLYEVQLNLVARWTNGSDIFFKSSVCDSGIFTDYEIHVEEESQGTSELQTLSGAGFIRTGTNDSLALDTWVEVEFRLVTGSTLWVKSIHLQLNKVEGHL